MDIKKMPQIAIVTPNMLTGIGLRNIIKKMLPGAEACLFGSTTALIEADLGQFFHYFVSARAFIADSQYFLERIHKTIVLIHGHEKSSFPAGLHTLNVSQTEEQLVRSVLKLAEMAHSAHHPQVVQDAKCPMTKETLTPRETEVLRLVVSGMINKEIADRLHVSLATIISHRKNITDKLRIKSVSGLTIYAVMHGIIHAEEI